MKFIEKHKVSLLFILYFILLTGIIFSVPDGNQDIFFMIAHGRVLTSTGLTTIEPLTIHGFHFTFEKWASCILFYNLYNYSGLIGIDIFSYICTIIIWLAVYYFTFTISKDKLKSVVISGLILLCYSLFFVSKRPSLISNIIFVIELIYLEKYSQSKKFTYLLILPILSFILIQFHSTMFPVFYLCILPYMFNRTDLKWEKRNIFSLLGIIILSTVTACVNPYNYGSIIYLIKSLSLSKYAQITELSKLSLSNIPLFLMVTIPVIVFGIKCREKIPVRYYFLFFGFCLAAFWAVRNVQYFLILSVPILSIFNYKRIPSLFSAGIVTIIIFLALTFSTSLVTTVKYTLATDYNVPLGSKVFTDGNNGSYLEFLGYKTYLDSRAEVFIEEINREKNVITEYTDLVKGEISLSDFQNMYNFEYYYVENTTLNNLIRNNTNWIELGRKNEEILWQVP